MTQREQTAEMVASLKIPTRGDIERVHGLMHESSKRTGALAEREAIVEFIRKEAGAGSSITFAFNILADKIERGRHEQ